MSSEGDSEELANGFCHCWARNLPTHDDGRKSGQRRITQRSRSSLVRVIRSRLVVERERKRRPREPTVANISFARGTRLLHPYVTGGHQRQTGLVQCDEPHTWRRRIEWTDVLSPQNGAYRGSRSKSETRRSAGQRRHERIESVRHRGRQWPATCATTAEWFPRVHTATRTTCFPTLSPENSPRNASGAFSKPSTTVSRWTISPFATHVASCSFAVPNRGA